MKNFIYLLALVQLLGCNTIDKKTDKTVSENKTVKESTDSIYYVNAKSGLHYRDEPNGRILGKFPNRTKLELVVRTAVFEEINDRNTILKGEWVGVNKNKDTVYVFDGFLKASNGIDKGKLMVGNDSSNDIWSSFSFMKMPVADSTNFDNIKKTGALNANDIKKLQLATIYPELGKEGSVFVFIPGYQLIISDTFKTFVVYAYRGDHELESTLITYDSKNKLIDAKVIAYDEIAEGWFRKKSIIKKRLITTIDSFYGDVKKIDTTLYHINELGEINEVKTIFQNNIRPDETIVLNKEYTDTIQFLSYNDDYDYFFMEGKKNDKDVSLIYSWGWSENKKYDFKPGDMIKVKWKMDSITIAGDGETLQFTEKAMDAEKL
ncbi:hypothetical protein GCM10022393_37820 [Aquimarina addita]|uniref:SH3 domain-containing protein n=1 Tax=Aquimarina addita TaxID=870485 RepID=A0ABP6URW8_9FLAO